MMKKLLTVFTLFVVLVSMPSCSLNGFVESIKGSDSIDEIDVTDPDFDINNLPFDPHTADISTYKKLKEVTQQLSLEVLDCFDNHDKEKLMEMFAPGISEEYDLSYQIDKAFEIYDSKSVTYERLSTEEDIANKREGIYVKSIYSGELVDIECEDGNEYELIVAVCYVNDECPDEIGVYEIYLKDGAGVNLRIIGAYDKSQAHLAE